MLLNHSLLDGVISHDALMTLSRVTLQCKFLVSKETVVLRRWERSKQKFGFIKRVDKGEILPRKIWKADVSSVSPSSERIE